MLLLVIAEIIRSFLWILYEIVDERRLISDFQVHPINSSSSSRARMSVGACVCSLRPREVSSLLACAINILRNKNRIERESSFSDETVQLGDPYQYLDAVQVEQRDHDDRRRRYRT